MKLEHISTIGFYPFSDAQREQVRAELAVYEGLISSASPWNVITYLNQQFKDVIKVDRDHNKETDTVVIYVVTSSKHMDADMFKSLLVFINKLGWFPSALENKDTKRWSKFDETQAYKTLSTSKKGIELQLEAKFDVVELKVPSRLYHAVPANKADKISKIGITPRSASNMVSYPDRIYLAKDLDNLTNVLLPHLADVKGVHDWVIFEITDIATISPALRLFKDPLYPHGYYTLQNIHPDHLKLIRRLDA